MTEDVTKGNECHVFIEYFESKDNKLQRGVFFSPHDINFIGFVYFNNIEHSNEILGKEAVVIMNNTGKNAVGKKIVHADFCKLV